MCRRLFLLLKHGRHFFCYNNTIKEDNGGSSSFSSSLTQRKRQWQLVVVAFFIGTPPQKKMRRCHAIIFFFFSYTKKNDNIFSLQHHHTKKQHIVVIFFFSNIKKGDNIKLLSPSSLQHHKEDKTHKKSTKKPIERNELTFKLSLCPFIFGSCFCPSVSNTFSQLPLLPSYLWLLVLPSLSYPFASSFPEL